MTGQSGEPMRERRKRAPLTNVRLTEAMWETDPQRHWKLIFDLAQEGCPEAADRLLDLPLRDELAKLDLRALEKWKDDTRKIGKRTARQIVAALEILPGIAFRWPVGQDALLKIESLDGGPESDPIEDPLLLLLAAGAHDAIDDPRHVSAGRAKTCLAMLRDEPEPTDPWKRARHLLLFGKCLKYIDETTEEDQQEAERRARQAFDIYAEAGDSIGQAEALEVQASILEEEKPFEAAALLERAAGLHEEAGNPFSGATALGDAALLARGGEPEGPVTEVSERALRKASDVLRAHGLTEQANTTEALADPPLPPRSCGGIAFSLVVLGALVFALLKGADMILSLFLLGVAILIHEAGHALAAVAARIPLRRFRIGLGTRLFSFRFGRTRVEMCALPFLGFVEPAYTTRPWYEWRERRRRAGEAAREEEPAGGLGEKPCSYVDLVSRPRRLAFVLGGPAANFVAALLLFWAASAYDEASRIRTAPVLGDVPPGSFAGEAGLQRGDRIISAGGEPVTHFETRRMTSLLDASPEPRWIAIVVERDSATLELAWRAPATRPDPKWAAACAGLEPLRTWTISRVHASAADRLQPGDEILSASWRGWSFSSEIHRSSMALSWLFRRAGGEPVTLTIRRGGDPPAEVHVEAAVESSPNYLAGLELEPRILRVREESPAWAAGLRPDDRIVAVDGQPTGGYSEMSRLLDECAPRAVSLEIQREGASLRLDLPPEPMRADMPDRGIAEGLFASSLEGLRIVSVPPSWRDLRPLPPPGDRIEGRFFYPSHELRWRNAFGETFRIGLKGAAGVEVTEETSFLPPFELATPTVVLPPLGPAEAASRILANGPRFITSLPRIMAGAIKGRDTEAERGWILREVRKSPWRIARILAVFCCVALYFNLLPIPPLDGFRAGCTIIEMATRRDLSKKATGIISKIGCAVIALLILLNVILLVKDLFVALFG